MPNTGAKKVGGAFVEIFADDSRLVQGLRAASAKLKAWGKTVSSLGAKISAASTAVMTPMLGGVQQFVSAGDALDKMSGRLGVSVEFLSALSHAAKLGGTDIATMENSIRHLQRSAYQAANGSGAAAEAFAELGINVRQQNGQLKSSEQLFMEAAAALSRMEDGTKKAALATILFGEAGAQLLPMLRDGKEGLIAAMEEAKRLGLVMSAEDAAAAARLADAWTRLTSVIKMTAVRIGAALAPALTDLTERITNIVRPVIDWIKNNSRLVASIFKIAAIVAGAGGALVALGGVISGLGMAFRILASVLVPIGGLLGALLSPIGLVATALVTLGGYLLHVSGTGEKALSWLGQKFNSLRETALAAWQGISDALAAGDIGLAARILWLTLKMEWQKGINWLQEKWIAFKGFFVDIFQKAVFGIARFMTDAWAGVQIAWVETTTFLRNTWDQLIGALKKGWNHFSGFFKKVWARVKAIFSDTDAEAEIARINEEIAQQDEEINRQRDQKIAEREQERQRRLTEIEQQRQGAQEELDKMQAEEQARREKKYQEELKAAEDKLAEARRQWEEARAAATRKRKEAAEAPGTPEGAGAAPDIKRADVEAAAKKFEVRGTFSALAVAGLAAGGPTERIAKNTESMDKKLGTLVRQAREGRLVFS